MATDRTPPERDKAQGEQAPGGDGDYLTPDQFASRFGLSPVTVRVWLRSGSLRGAKVGPKLWRIPRAEVLRYAEQIKGGTKQ